MLIRPGTPGTGCREYGSGPQPHKTLNMALQAQDSHIELLKRQLIVARQETAELEAAADETNER